MADQAPAETPSATTPTPTPSPAPSAPPAVSPAKASNGAAPAAPADDKPLALGGGGEDKPVAAPVNWPENWPDIMAGGDPKAAAYYRRYASPVNVGKALLAFRSKMDAGEIARAKPEGDPDDPAVKQAMNEWRAQAGIPEKPDGYLDKVPDGLVFGDADKPRLEGFLKDMHAKDVPPAYVHEALRWYKQNEERAINERAVSDKKHRAAAEDEMRAEWGPDFRGKMNLVHTVVANEEWGGSKELATQLYSARMADGTPLGDHPAFLRWAASLGGELGLHHTVVGAGGASQAGAGRKAELEKLMGNSRSEYWQGPTSEKLKAEYRGILEAEEKAGKRRAA